MEASDFRARRMGVPEPIAIVGMGCRLPGAVGSPSDLWRMLQENRSGQCRTPLSKWNVDGFYNPDPDFRGTQHHDGGYFINDDVRAFDNGFFGINNLEAISMDPQQRNLLEVVYECLESAGATLEDVSGQNVGCYVGNFTTDYINISFKDPDSITRYGATGIGTTVLSNRISHIFNLAGPSFVIDTACSSSLYALHNACLALQAGETDAALVCGTSLLMSPEQHIATVKAGVLSPTSTCHSFDESADGYGRAEGVGVLYIKRLSDAVRNRDPVRSIIRGTALNCNGRTFGITLPSIEGQEAVIRKAYSKAGVALGETDYVECHGTGTKVGDPIEVEALSRVFNDEREDPLLLGSVKTNVGHSEAASGITSIIKATLMLETATIPPTHGLRRINPKIRTKEWNVRIVTQNEPWPRVSLRKPRRASINSFGYGGANAHAVLENFDHSEVRINGFRNSEPEDDWTFILPFSAKTQNGLLKRVRSLAQRNNSTHTLVDLAYTLGCRRSLFSVRGFLLVRSGSLVEDLQEKHLIQVQEQIGLEPLPIAMIFTGQGAQWPQMGLTLIDANKSFRSTIRTLDIILQTLQEPPDWTIEETLRADTTESYINHPSRSQPVCTAIQIALVEILRQWRIVPRVVIGHSSGEIAAAYAAGHITSHEAVAIAYYRGLVLAGSTFRGAMMAIAMSQQEADAEIMSAGLGAAIRVACKNSHESSTLSGSEEAIDTLLESLTHRKVFARKLRTNGMAYHSYNMVKHGPAYESFLCLYLQGRESPTIDASMPRMISSVTGKEVDATRTSHPSYWRANLESLVDFVGAISTALNDGGYHFLELGPHSALELPLREISTYKNVGYPFLYASAILRGTDSIGSLLNAVGKLFVHGHNIAFGRVNAIPGDSGSIPDIPAGRVVADLPRYPWEHDMVLWNESRMSTEYRSRKHPRHELLGSIVPGGSTRSTTWRNLIRLKEVPWLADHRLEDNIVFPAAGYLAMVVEALSRILHPLAAFPRFCFRSVKFLNALIMPPDADTSIELMTDMRICKLSQTTDSKTWYQFEISSVASSASTRHATGLISMDIGGFQVIDEIASIRDHDLEQLDPKRWYEQLATRGLIYGPQFRLLHCMYAHRGQSRKVFEFEILVSNTEVSASHKDSRHVMHPAIIDALLQTGLIADSCGDVEQLRAGLPVSIERLALTLPEPQILPRLLSVRTTASQVGFGTILFDLELHDTESRLVASMHGVRMTEYIALRPDAELLQRSSILDIVWKPDMEYLQPFTSQAFLEYIRNEAVLPAIDGIQHVVRQLVSILDLIMHKKPTCRVLTIEGVSSKERELGEAIRTIAGYGSLHRRCEAYAQGRLEASGNITAINCVAEERDQNSKQISENERFDVIVFPTSRSVDVWLANPQQQVQTLLVDSACIVCLEGDCEEQLTTASFEVLSAHRGPLGPLTLARLHKTATTFNARAPGCAIVVVPDEQSLVIERILQSVAATASFPLLETKLSKVGPETIESGAIVVALLELENPVLCNLKSKEMQAMKIINGRARTVLWVTAGDLLGATKPDMSVAFGYFRTMRLEHYPTRFGILDIDYPRTPAEIIGIRISDVLSTLEAHSKVDDEFVLHDGLIQVSRMMPQSSLELSLANKRSKKTVKIPRREMGAAELMIRQPGNFSTVGMRQHQWAFDPIQEGEVEIEILAVGLNAKDLYTLRGHANTRNSTSLLECVGTVRATGNGVSNLYPGDRIIVMAPQKFSTVIRVPHSCCCKLLAHENSLEMATVPFVLSSALYALQHRARLQPHESVLIHSASGGLGQAAIQVARLADAEVFATAGTEERRRYLHEVLGIARNRIYDSRNASFIAEIMRETAERGVDVVLNSLSGDLLHASWSCVAEFGRFIEVGKRDITEAGNLDMSIFGKGTSFSAFDLTDLYYSKNPMQNAIWSELLHKSVHLVREGICLPVKPLRVFGLPNIKEAFLYFASSDRFGKVVIDFAVPDLGSPVEVIADRYKSVFSPQKTYLLVGCLGGIGRYLSRWMMSRGARNFVFIGRSGADRLAAKLLVEELTRAGAKVKVVRGDVCNADATAAALRETDKAIGGVIQAAMTLKEALFSQMDISDWHLGLASKVQGTWNLHHGLRGHDSELDFFVMTSSITGSIGQATESNYSAANAFLDTFARHRRSLGLPGTSIALGAIKGIGYLAEHPEAEAILKRQGFRAMDEEELLQVIDLAISGYRTPPGSAEAKIELPTILTGLDEQNPLKRVMDDPRASILAAAASRLSSDSTDAEVNKDGRVPDLVIDALSASDKKALCHAAEKAVAEKLAALVQMPTEQVKAQTKLIDIGMDSMLAVMARQEATFGAEVPLTDFTAPMMTVGEIGARVAEGLWSCHRKG